MSGAWVAAWQEGFAGFAWPWAWALLPLPLLVRLLLPARRSTAPALRVPWSGRLDGVAGVSEVHVQQAEYAQQDEHARGEQSF